MKKFAQLVLTSLVATTAFLNLTLPVQAEKVLEGQVCTERVHALTNDIDWQKNLKKAEEMASQQGKLIFWLHILGHIDGAT
jgi:hypothetical protein